LWAAHYLAAPGLQKCISARASPEPIAHTIADGVVTLTDRSGKPVRVQIGKTYSYKLAETDDPRVIAGRLTKEFRRTLIGSKGGFSGPINYPNLGKIYK